MRKHATPTLYAVTAMALIGLGLHLAAWWPIAGGVVSAVIAAWFVTEDS